MPRKPLAPVSEQVLQAWRVNSSINVKLVRGIPAKGFDSVPLASRASRARTVRRQLMHMHKVHAGWLRYNGMKLEGAAKPFARDHFPSRRELVAAFRASGRAVEKLLRDKLTAEQRVKFFQGKPVRFLFYLVAHDSHHRGQIALTLKQAGYKLPETTALRDVWYSWYGGEPS